MLHLEYGVEESSTNTLDCQTDEQEGPRGKPETSPEAKMTKLKLSDFRHIMRRQCSLKRTAMLENRSQQEKRKTKCKMD